MPVFYSPIPQNLRMGLASVGGSVFTNNRTGDFSSDYNKDQDDKTVNELVSHLPLQMILYFNIFYFPCWWVSAVLMLDLKLYYLPGYYQALLVTGVVLLTICEITRLYLGYIGNLKEKSLSLCSSLSDQVPELAGFWLISFLFQLPILLFFLTDEDIIILPLERAVHSIYLLFILSELLASFFALRAMTRKLTLLFHLRQFVEVENLHHLHHHHLHLAGKSPAFGMPYYGRTVLPMPPHSNNVHSH
ncbi:transmembrane protein 17A isoform X1 [Salmo salar]|uniref:Transmembrane protein 17A isoform X1 n=1 Tax=Salmo salar TaxID=8030 RepID=A0A1S3NJQ4_SALSA|nr:transmembrane protein 17A isoform X1 [Salmo salar]|eukprot:XP_014015490.1 PREDICTED: transmembrane protein 17A-like isoform X1 [Salmo salar]